MAYLFKKKSTIFPRNKCLFMSMSYDELVVLFIYVSAYILNNFIVVYTEAVSLREAFVRCHADWQVH